VKVKKYILCAVAITLQANALGGLRLAGQRFAACLSKANISQTARGIKNFTSSHVSKDLLQSTKSSTGLPKHVFSGKASVVKSIVVGGIGAYLLKKSNFIDCVLAEESDFPKFDFSKMKTKQEGWFWLSRATEKKEAEWVFHKEEGLPKEHDKPWEGQQVFLNQLKKFQNDKKVTKARARCMIVSAFDPNEYLSSSVFFYKDGNVTVEWPEALIYYIEKHNVMPSKEFYDFVMSKVR